MVCNGYVTKLVQSHDTEDCQPSNQVLGEATPSHLIQIFVVYQPPWSMDMPTSIK
jgi:hypothetical protein